MQRAMEKMEAEQQRPLLQVISDAVDDSSMTMSNRSRMNMDGQLDDHEVVRRIMMSDDEETRLTLTWLAMTQPPISKPR